MEQAYKYMVVTRCFTFNHASFIVDAMNGFTMQETTFPVITLIVDDASTDGEPEVIKQYLTDHFKTPYRTEETDDYYLICANHNTNPNCTFVVFLLKYNHYSIKKLKMPYLSEWLDNAKYIALCEGDDFWVMPNKLQKQVDLLDENPKASLVATGYYNRINGRDVECTFHKRGRDYFFFDLDDWKKTYLTKTLTLIYRPEARNYYESIKSKFKYGRDVHLCYYLLRWGAGIYLSEATGVYNFHSGGICSSKSHAENAYIAYLCYKELLAANEDDSILKQLLFNSLCLRLKEQLSSHSQISIFKEGWSMSTNIGEKINLCYYFIIGQIKKLLL